MQGVPVQGAIAEAELTELFEVFSSINEAWQGLDKRGVSTVLINTVSTKDPKFASSVRGGSLRAPSARRRLQGAALFVIGVAMLVSGVAFKATMIGNFPILSVFGFVGMFGGVVLAITGPRMGGGRDKSGSASGAPRQRPAKHSGGSFTGRMEDRFRRRFDQ